MSHGLLRELAKRGHDVDMASLGFGSSAHEALKQVASCPLRLTDDDIERRAMIEELTHRYSP